MNILPDEYCGDKTMSEILRKAGSKLSVSEVYGLFYGCLAAPELVMPSRYMTLIFGEEGREFRTKEEAEKIYGNLMSLWNLLSGWKPESEPCLFPDTDYPDTYSGLRLRVKDNSSLIEYFIKGLDMGGTDETDFSEDGMKALQFLSKANVLFLKFAELIEMQEKENDKEIEKTSESIWQLEDVMKDCMARINLGLKEARIKAVADMRMFAEAQRNVHQARSSRIGRNDPCPCGSGKKHKKCCGLMH